MKSGIDPETLSRDPAGRSSAYRKDKLVHDIVSLGFGRDALDGVDAVLAGASRLAVPLLRDPRRRGRARLRVSGARELAALAPDVCTLQIYDGLFHEIHHEPEQAQVFADVLAWIEGSALPSRTAAPAAVAQLVEHVTRNDGVSGSNPLGGSPPLAQGGARGAG